MALPKISIDHDLDYYNRILESDEEPSLDSRYGQISWELFHDAMVHHLWKTKRNTPSLLVSDIVALLQAQQNITSQRDSDSEEDNVYDESTMTSHPSPSREELMARIEASEARADARFIAFEKRVDDAVHKIELDLAPLKNIKLSIWGAAATVIATFIGVVAVYVGAFDSGRETSKLAAEAQTKSAQAQQETAAALIEIRQIVDDMKKLAPVAEPAQQAVTPDKQ